MQNGKIKNGTWLICDRPKMSWVSGEYLIERNANNSITIWVNNQAGVTNIKSFKSALNILHEEFYSVNIINR